jgi:hypothetical protein
MEWSEGVQRLAGPRPRQRMPGCWFSLFVRGVRPGERAWGARRRPGGRRESRQGSESGRAGSQAWDIRDRVFGRKAAVSERGSGSIGAVRGPVGGFPGQDQEGGTAQPRSWSAARGGGPIRNTGWSFTRGGGVLSAQLSCPPAISGEVAVGWKGDGGVTSTAVRRARVISDERQSHRGNRRAPQEFGRRRGRSW